MNINITKVKIVTMVPEENLEEVRNAICTSGAGVIGEYTFCTSTTHATTGTFIPSSNANPYIGSSNKLEKVKEEKLEVVCPVEKVKAVIQKLRENHPYEEPGIDIIPLLDEGSFN